MSKSKTYQTIEVGKGATYSNGAITVYEYGTYPRSSVLAGQERRTWMDEFDTIDAAKLKYPNAVACIGSGYQEPSLDHLPDPDGPDPLGDNEREAADYAHEGDE